MLVRRVIEGASSICLRRRLIHLRPAGDSFIVCVTAPGFLQTDNSSSQDVNRPDNLPTSQHRRKYVQARRIFALWYVNCTRRHVTIPRCVLVITAPQPCPENTRPIWGKCSMIIAVARGVCVQDLCHPAYRPQSPPFLCPITSGTVAVRASSSQFVLF